MSTGSLPEERMNPYSHLVIAAKLETLVKPERRDEYYWGAIAPDTRYLAAVQRQQTHLASQRIVEFAAQYPHLKSFLQGYLVHCLSDEVDLGEIFFQRFPFDLLRSKLSRQHLSVLLELFYFENEKINTGISDMHNEVLTELGLSEAVSARFSRSIRQYALVLPSRTRLSELFKLLDLENDSRIEKYRQAAERFQTNRLLKNVLFLGIRTGKISEKIVLKVVSLWSAVQSGI